MIVFCNLTMFLSIVCGEAQSLSSWPVGPNQAKNVSRQGQSESNYSIAESILKCLETSKTKRLASFQTLSLQFSQSFDATLTV